MNQSKADRLKQNKRTLVLLLGGGHGSWGGEDMALTAQEMYAFLKRHLSP